MGLGYSSATVRVLALETSCDDTAVAVLDCTAATATAAPRLQLRCSLLHSQDASHARFGGVVPEVASREHLAHLQGLVAQATAACGGAAGIDAVAVTRGPGLVGALLVGLQFAKGLALALQRPWVGVHHLEGHLSAALLAPQPPAYPHVALLVSGGHTQLFAVAAFGAYRLLGASRDDAAGEAFDKVAKILGLGYPGGRHIEAASAGGDPRAVALPRALPGASLDFSFSGLKTAASRFVQQQGGRLQGAALADFCASVQEAICSVLVRKAVRAAQQAGLPGIVLGGGVAANGRLRTLLAEAAAAEGTDNAAMIAAAGALRLQAGETTAWEQSARSRWPLSELRRPGAASTPAAVPAGQPHVGRAAAPCAAAPGSPVTGTAGTPAAVSAGQPHVGRAATPCAAAPGSPVTGTAFAAAAEPMGDPHAGRAAAPSAAATGRPATGTAEDIVAGQVGAPAAGAPPCRGEGLQP